ncbi:MAG: cytochrome C oxidase subunit IV family protein [Myxococcota bacterium]|nr:cytochrome C oxidase subunit IV family protein [Myxococcota bacterium]
MMEVHIDRKQYWVIFVALAVLTLIEVGVVYLDITWGQMVFALTGLAVAKAAIVGYYYMHLGHETITLQMTVLVPMLVPGFYAIVLILEAAWRMIF